MKLTAPDVAAKLVKEESERLGAYLADLPPDAWARPSACGDWEVRDVVAHLAGAARLYTDMASRGLQGDSSTPEGRPAPGSPDFLGSYGAVIAIAVSSCVRALETESLPNTFPPIRLSTSCLLT